MFGRKAREIERLTQREALALGRIGELRDQVAGLVLRNESLRDAYKHMQQRLLTLHPEEEPALVRPYVYNGEPPVDKWARELGGGA